MSSQTSVFSSDKSFLTAIFTNATLELINHSCQNDKKCAVPAVHALSWVNINFSLVVRFQHFSFFYFF